jgi:addiction module HigA family antidote
MFSIIYINPNLKEPHMAKTIVPSDAIRQKMGEFYVSVGQLAKDVNLSQSFVRQLLSGKSKISIPVAFKLAKYFNTTVEYWYELQTSYDFAEFRKDAVFAKEIKEIAKAKKPSAKEIAALEAKNGKPAKKTAKTEAPAKRGKAVSAPAKTVKEKPAAKVKAAQEPAKRTRKAVSSEEPVKRTGKPGADTIAGVKPRTKRVPKKAVVEDAPQKEKFVPEVILIKKQEVETQTVEDQIVESQDQSDPQGFPSSDPGLF